MKKAFWLTMLFLAGCFSCRENVVTVAEADGSNDHRIFRIGSLTAIMLEPVLWKLEDTEKINFDLPVTIYFKDRLPKEYRNVTLRMLHDGKSGLPRDFIDPWCLSDVGDSLGCGLLGFNLYGSFDHRADFVRKLRAPRARAAIRHRRYREYSNVGYALMLMAITDELGISLQELCEEYLVKTYGLKDTTFIPNEGMKERLTPACAGSWPWLLPEGAEVPENRDGEVTRYAGGMLSSASDMLKIGYVMLPHLDRARALLASERLDLGHWVYYRTGMTCGGNAFLGFDTKRGRIAVVLGNETRDPGDEVFDFMRTMYEPPKFD